MVYESPDGGDTVYVRESGSTERRLHSISQKKQTLAEEIRESRFWADVHRAARTDPALAGMLEQIKIYWHLKNP